MPVWVFLGGWDCKKTILLIRKQIDYPTIFKGRKQYPPSPVHGGLREVELFAKDLRLEFPRLILIPKPLFKPSVAFELLLEDYRTGVHPHASGPKQAALCPILHER